MGGGGREEEGGGREGGEGKQGRGGGKEGGARVELCRDCLFVLYAFSHTKMCVLTPCTWLASLARRVVRAPVEFLSSSCQPIS